MGKMINTFHTERMQRLIKTAGGQVVMGGKVNLEAKYCDPTVIAEPDLKSELMTNEIFGPILPVIPFREVEEVINMINSKDKPLAIYYFGKESEIDVIRIARWTSSGAFVCNEVMMHLASHYQGFGGVGASGYGRYSGKEGFKHFSNRKAVLRKGAAPALVNAIICPPYSEREKKTLRWITPFAVHTTQWEVVKVLLVVAAFLVAGLANKYYFRLL